MARLAQCASAPEVLALGSSRLRESSPGGSRRLTILAGVARGCHDDLPRERGRRPLALARPLAVLCSLGPCLGRARCRRLPRPCVSDPPSSEASPGKEEAAPPLPCAAWGCRCGEARGRRLYGSGEDYRRGHPAVRRLSAWCQERGLRPPPVYRAADPRGYRTRATFGVGPGEADGRAVVGLFRSRAWQVVPPGDCAVNHPALKAAAEEVQRALDGLRGVLLPFDHGAPEPWRLPEGALRHVELTVERPSGRVQLVLVWNGHRGPLPPALERLLEALWPREARGGVQRWHSIWVHWRAPDFDSQRAIHSKAPAAWEQVRPPAPQGGAPERLVEELDGLSFSFGPASFQQANLGVFERILRDMKAAVRRILPPPSEGDRRPVGLLELCGGVGVIGLSLAHALASRGPRPVALLSTDLNPGNAGPFRANASAALLAAGGPAAPASSAEFRALSSEDVLGRLACPSGGRSLGLDPPAEVLILDPPRRGLARDWREVGRWGPRGGEREAAAIRRCASLRAVLYMSCGHESFTVDADRLTCALRDGPGGRGGGCGRPFRLAALACYDMFPFTAQIETLGLFVR